VSIFYAAQIQTETTDGQDLNFGLMGFHLGTETTFQCRLGKIGQWEYLLGLWRTEVNSFSAPCKYFGRRLVNVLAAINFSIACERLMSNACVF
jgi:hypothetical protein